MGKYKYWFYVTNAKEKYKDRIGSCIGCPYKQENLTTIDDKGKIETICWGIYLGRIEKEASQEEHNKKLDEFKSKNAEYLNYKLKQKNEERV